MKRYYVSLCLLFIMLVRTVSIAENAYSVQLNEEDVSFYKHCYDVAVVHMDKATREDPEGYYKHWTAIHQGWPEEHQEQERKRGMLFGWPDEQDIPRERAILLSYAALEQLGGIQRDMLSQYYSEALLDVSDEDKPVWWVFSIMANDYYVPSSTQYELFIDARSGEIIRFEVHAPENAVG